ncbi:FAS1-like dehydratase domain-containing protein [Streptomyces sp. GQFP]|uniref:FAS1-like dehydratase domain-containing protein n=1 Tax=Streptomyces sp. GQFP TaxID=2907545 RepID=UPI001F1D2027|nr:MaoC family dehydratase N-terminal domain-containing protein [Streptomyces sp. GQFP]UIX29381.1 MaoC family dehydratase N-terminal domain-containing protein [Streptomyces sp. GQFP]
MALRFPVEEGHVLAFARAVGEPPPGPGDLVPPTFTATTVQHDPEHMRDLRPTGALAAATADEGATVLHAEQHFEYLAPVRVGDVLHVAETPGRTWTKQSGQGGTLTFTELVKELRDDTGSVVVRSRMVLVTIRQEPS